jgi:hypothetical protein
MISLYLLSGLVMILLEALILLRVYKRSKTLEIISLIVAPLMIIFALWLTLWIQRKWLGNGKKGNNSIQVNYILLFVILALIELPLSLYGYEITPNASIPERMIVAGSVGVAAVLIAQGILTYF